MNGSQSNLTSASAQASGVDPDDVRRAETPIVTCLTRNEPEAAAVTCRQLYASAAGRYCMAALGDIAVSNRVLSDTWSRLPEELKSADLTRTMRSVVLGLVRRRCAYTQETQTQPAVPSPGSTSVATRDAGSLSQRARAVLARLRPSDRELLILRYVCHLTYTEIGTILGIEEDEARVRISNALANATRLSDSEGAVHG